MCFSYLLSYGANGALGSKNLEPFTTDNLPRLLVDLLDIFQLRSF